MNLEGFEKFTKNARVATITKEIIQNALAIAIIIGLIFIIKSFEVKEEVSNLVMVIATLIITFSLISSAIACTIAFSRRRYRVSEESIEYMSGVWSHDHEIVPIRRMQQIEVSQGVIKRMFGLSDLEIITAGGSMNISGLKKERADELSKELTEKINEFALLEVTNAGK